jgi:hypothetical protein
MWTVKGRTGGTGNSKQAEHDVRAKVSREATGEGEGPDSTNPKSKAVGKRTRASPKMMSAKGKEVVGGLRQVFTSSLSPERTFY